MRLRYKANGVTIVNAFGSAVSQLYAIIIISLAALTTLSLVVALWSLAIAHHVRAEIRRIEFRLQLPQYEAQIDRNTP